MGVFFEQNSKNTPSAIKMEIEELKKLAGLRDADIITAKEFEAKNSNY